MRRRSRLWLTLLTLSSTLLGVMCAKSAEPPSKFLTRAPDSKYDYQKLPKGIYLPEDDTPGADKFEFSGCVGTAYLTFDIDYITGTWTDWHRRRLTTEMLCKCKKMLYRDSPENTAITPKTFSQIPLSLCIVSAQKHKKICDCELPRRLLPVIGKYSPNENVEDVEEIKANRLVVSESGQAAPKASAGVLRYNALLITGLTVTLALKYLLPN